MEARISNLSPDTLPISCLVWNVQGAGDRTFVSALRDMVNTHQPNVLVLVKTHIGGSQAQHISFVLGYTGHSRVDAVGFSGGIWVYWRSKVVTVEPILKHNQHITMNITRIGASHTWARGLSPETRRSAWLDKALCNGDWGLRFDKAKVKHLLASHSDHCPIFISPNGFALMNSLSRPFRFQATWISHENFNDFVSEKWNNSSSLIHALSQLAEDLQEWNRNVFGNIFHQKRKILARIAGVQSTLSNNVNRGLIKLESKLRRELGEILDREETLWYQKSRIDGLKNRDRNTTFFNLSIIVRRWRNKIVGELCKGF
ncbi:uncharacterized protein [Spinacia oleracea]|uniref:Endonuclease/exonuclease/phosphatase domain-containing protein n=1 Tax=Spinacia oleracea TaxID=3562 RepID=A0ABM3RSV5_SPIOL|nr:uncharacterized protein LOC130472219 [Spinacia oleracea]